MTTRSRILRSPLLHTCHSSPFRPISRLSVPHLRKHPSPPTLQTPVDRIFTTLEPHPYNPPPRFRRIVTDVTPPVWAAFRSKYGEHRGFAGMTFEYDAAKGQLIAVRISEPLRDIPRKVMHMQIYTRMRDAQLDAQSRIEALGVTRKFAENPPSASKCRRKPDCVLWTPDYEAGTAPTMLWGVTFKQRPSPEERAVEWYRHYNGKVGVIIILRFGNNDPRALTLEVFRRSPGVGPCYRALVREISVTEKEGVALDDSIPFTYADYFGCGNVGVGVDPGARFDLPLELVRREVSRVISMGLREQFYAARDGEAGTV